MYKKSIEFLQDICNYNLNKERKKEVSLIIVSHILPDKIDFINILSNYFRISYIIPKPKSIDEESYRILEKKYKILNISRELIFENKECILKRFKKINTSIVIIDIWWYFAKPLPFLEKGLWKKLLWIIEDTENGHQKYEKLLWIKTPILSVARSILKEPEDLLVGQSIVFSTDYVLRLGNTLLNNKFAVVIWFWKIWKSISGELRWKNIQLGIHDIDSYKWLEAVSLWYSFIDKEKTLKNADILFCATWGFSIQWREYFELKDGVIISSVTSSDDELDIEFLEENFSKIEINKYTTKYSYGNKSIYLLNQWNAVNFINNAVVGSFIYLVQAEIIHGIFELLSKKKSLEKNKIELIENAEKSYIANLWLKHFNK